MTAPTPLWFDDPTNYAPACGSSAQAEPQSVDAGVHQPRAGAPECPKCHTAEPPRLVTFDGIDSGTGEQIHEERFRCSCGFVGDSEEFEIVGRPASGCATVAGVGVGGDTLANLRGSGSAAALPEIGTGGEQGWRPSKNNQPNKLCGRIRRERPSTDSAAIDKCDSMGLGNREHHVAKPGRFESCTPASISPRIERGTGDGSSCPF